jgi:hypothetical protein
MRGAIHPLPYTSSWRGALLSIRYAFVVLYFVKHREMDGFNLSHSDWLRAGRSGFGGSIPASRTALGPTRSPIRWVTGGGKVSPE